MVDLLLTIRGKIIHGKNHTQDTVTGSTVYYMDLNRGHTETYPKTKN